jgi:hypothetical protein
VEVHAGVHAGEIERDRVGLKGLAVDVGARVAEIAGSGEVLVSSTVKDLVGGAGIKFEDRGVRTLNGVPGEWQLYAVLWVPAEEGSEHLGHAAQATGIQGLQQLSARRAFLVGGTAFACAAAVAAVLAAQPWLRRVLLRGSLPTGQPRAFSVSGERNLAALQPPLQSVSVVADDAGAQPRLDEAVKDLSAILAQFANDYGPPPATYLTVHLTTNEVDAKQLMAQKFKLDPAAISNFFAANSGRSVMAVATPPDGVGGIIYLPNNTNLRGVLAYAAATYYLGLGGYPRWFARGFVVYAQVRFSEGTLSLRQTAVNDVQAGTAPSLADLGSGATVQAFEAAAPSNPARVDARSEAAVEYLARKYGEVALGRFLREGRFPAFNDALQQITGMSLDDFNAALTASLQ